MMLVLWALEFDLKNKMMLEGLTFELKMHEWIPPNRANLFGGSVSLVSLVASDLKETVLDSDFNLDSIACSKGEK